MKKLFTLLLAVSLLFSIAVTSAAAEGTGGTMYPNPLQDVRVRQALWYAIDMDAIVDALWNGTVTAAHKSLVPEGYWQADGLTEYTYNPEKAKELLAEAGWDGSRTLKAVYYTGNLLDTITAIQADWNPLCKPCMRKRYLPCKDCWIRCGRFICAPAKPRRCFPIARCMIPCKPSRAF